MRCLARGRSRADIKFGDFAYRCGAKEVLGEARGFIHQRAVRGHAGERQAGRRAQEVRAGRLGGLQQCCLQRCGDQGLQVAPPDFRVGVFGAYDFALFRKTDLAAHRTGRLGQDGLVAGAAAAPHGPAATMEHPQLDGTGPGLGGELVEQLDQCNLGQVQLPVAGKDATILVAVGITQHDVLLGTAAPHQRRHAGQGIELAHDHGRIAQVFDGLEQRYHDQFGPRLGVERAVHQPGFFLQQQYFEQVTHGFGVADDVVADGLGTVARKHVACAFKDRQLRFGQKGVGMVEHA